MHFFELFYYCGFSLKKLISLKARKRLPFTVISVGNLSTGGTGKTPAVIALAGAAKTRGFLPVILTRGYKGTAKGPCFVTRGERPLLGPREAGDEALLMAEKMRGVPVVKGADRYQSGMFAIKELCSTQPLLFILDDGFQHFRLWRDTDIVLIDAGNPFGNGMLLPFGKLREPVESLVRADILVVTKMEGDNEKRKRITETLKEYNRRAPVFMARHVPIRFRLVSGEERPLTLVSGKKVFAFCALGSPDSLTGTITSIGAKQAGNRFYRDHHRYREGDIERITRDAKRCGAEWIVTTEKDIMKLRSLDLPENFLIIEVAFSADEDFYEKVFG